MSNLSIESTKQQQQSRGDSQIQSPKSKESKLESKQPTNIEFQLPGLLNLSILAPNHFQVIGKEGNAPGELSTPTSITQQRTTGRYFISEISNHRIQVLDENFTHQMFVGEKGSKSGKLNNPMGVAVSEEGRLAVCDSESQRLQIFDVSNEESRFISIVKFDSNPQSVVQNLVSLNIQ